MADAGGTQSPKSQESTSASILGLKDYGNGTKYLVPRCRVDQLAGLAGVLEVRKTSHLVFKDLHESWAAAILALLLRGRRRLSKAYQIPALIWRLEGKLHFYASNASNGIQCSLITTIVLLLSPQARWFLLVLRPLVVDHFPAKPLSLKVAELPRF